ncbi:uncharacterized protein GGS22DRAFT_199181 [Annulohypoxylon maeteangense]|uniref:uncharacterized protein n=1 Tax=Annulohypoxylon maeteangense TaxID=1927788 RepID=UPI002007CC5D|nr:uncharacterized protein GGS22DRAFT_199181 [Annulohypoxylon maeteangense]KAI0886859.1 hypothetical protein GGS22DRAFT_199181 [Annulohypoxylon maeteangense]
MGKNEAPEEGDKVSWSWGGGAPAGTVAETKEKGAIEIETQRGNTVKRKADPGNPAVRVERSGNDVVKRSSELTVEEKASENGKGGTKRKAQGQDPDKDARGDDGKNDESEDVSEEDADGDLDLVGDDEGPHTKNEQGKEVKKGGKEANKKQKREQVNGDEGKGEAELNDDEYIEEVDDVTDGDKTEAREEAKRGNDTNGKHVVFKGSEEHKKAEANPKHKTKASDNAKEDATNGQEEDQVSTCTRSHTDA